MNNNITMRAIVKGLLMFALCIMTIYATAQLPDKSDAYVAHLGKKILDRIHENEALERNGEADKARYLIVDGPSDDNPNWFYYDFTSLNAIQLWEKRGWLEEATMGKDISAETGNLNKWINELRNTYLGNTKYKDQKIYFVVSGIYNYDNVDEKDKDYDWAKMHSVSFDNTVKQTAQGGFSDKESAIVNKILSKVTSSDKNAELKKIVEKGDYIICFIFNLYKSFPGTQIITEHVITDNSLVGRIRTREVFVSKPKTFLIDGYFFGNGADQEIIKNVQSFVASHTSNGDAEANASVENRNNYLSEFIRNVFLSFSPIKESTDCASDATLRDKLQGLYSKGLSDGTYDISASLKDLSLLNRLCLLKQLAGSTFCGDGNNWFLQLNNCENLIVDLVKGTPANQRRHLLDYFNANNSVLKDLISKLHDEGPGAENFTTFIITLSQYAYEEYANDFSTLVSGSDYCSFLAYNPTKPFNTYSNTILADYNRDNSITFEFRNYDGPCYTQYFDAQGKVSYASAKRTLKPFEFIGVIPMVDLPVKLTSNGSRKVTMGQKLFVPAVMLYWNVKRNNTREAVKGLELSANILSFFIGLGEVRLTGTILGRIILTAEGTTTFANMVVNSESVKQAILRKEGGAEFLETVSTINNLSGAATIGYLALAKLGRAVKFWNTYKADFTATGIMDFERISARMNDLEGALVKDGFIYTKGAKAVDKLEELFTAIKNSLLKRLEVEKNMKFKYTDDDLRAMIKTGNQLNLPKPEIEDIIFNGCRIKKDFSVAQITDQLNYWKFVKQRGFPNLFADLQEFEKFNAIVKRLAKKWGLPEDAIYMQGSSLRMSNAAEIGDFDVAIKVNASKFEELVENFKNRAKTDVTKNKIGKNGKISGTDMKWSKNNNGSFIGEFYKEFAKEFGQEFTPKFGLEKIQISVIQEGGRIDVSPYLKMN